MGSIFTLAFQSFDIFVFSKETENRLDLGAPFAAAVPCFSPACVLLFMSCVVIAGNPCARVIL